MYTEQEFIEFAQLFIGDDKTIHIEDNPTTWPDEDGGYWVKGWFKVTTTMVDRYRQAMEESLHG